MPLADLQSKLEVFLKDNKGGGTRFGPALKEALNVIGDVHHQIGYPPLLMLMSDGGSSDGESEMVYLGRSLSLTNFIADRHSSSKNI